MSVMSNSTPNLRTRLNSNTRITRFVFTIPFDCMFYCLFTQGLSESPCPVEDCLTLISKKVRKLELHDKQNSSEEAPVNDLENANGLQDDQDSRKDSRPSTSHCEPRVPYGKYDSFSKTPSASCNELKQSVSHQPPGTSLQQPIASYSHYASTSYDEMLPRYKEECGNDEILCAIYKKQCAIYEEGPSVKSSVGCLQLDPLDNASTPFHQKVTILHQSLT